MVDANDLTGSNLHALLCKISQIWKLAQDNLWKIIISIEIFSSCIFQWRSNTLVSGNENLKYAHDLYNQGPRRNLCWDFLNYILVYMCNYWVYGWISLSFRSLLLDDCCCGACINIISLFCTYIDFHNMFSILTQLVLHMDFLFIKNILLHYVHALLIKQLFVNKSFSIAHVILLQIWSNFMFITPWFVFCCI